MKAGCEPLPIMGPIEIAVGATALTSPHLFSPFFPETPSPVP